MGNQAIIDENNNLLRVIKSNSYTFDYLLNYAFGITQNSIFFKRDVFDKIGYIDEKLNYAMDRDFFIRVCSLMDIPYINETLAEFRMQPEAKTAEGSYKFAMELIKIRKKYGGNLFSPASRNDFYLIITQPLRQIKWLRKIIRQLKGIEK